MYNHAVALGAVVTSSGGLRDLSAEVTPGRSSTSLHYLGRAVDLYIRSGMQSERDPYLVVRDGGSDEQPLWRVHCVSMSPRTDDPLYDSSLVREGKLECAIWQRGIGYRTIDRFARFVCLTNVMARYGWARVPSRSLWREDYLAVEWWHFQNEAGLDVGRTVFGDELRKIWSAEDVARSGLPLDAVWSGGSFCVDTPVAAPHQSVDPR
jgi:hypothetical protein